MATWSEFETCDHLSPSSGLESAAVSTLPLGSHRAVCPVLGAKVVRGDKMNPNGYVRGFRRATVQMPFEHLEQNMDDIIGDGGLLKEVIHPGEGPPVPRKASVIMHYSGYLEYSDVPYETTAHVKYPRIIKLGRDMTLLGIELAVLTMRKGEFSRFLMKPQYAYGNMGCPPLIPAAATLLYEVHILDYLDSGQVDEFVAMNEEEQKSVNLENLLQIVMTLRSFGNRYFSQSRYENAKGRYKQALRLLGNRLSQGDSEKGDIERALLPLYLNLSLTELRLENPPKALKYGNKALKIDSTNTKALFRCGQAYLELREYESAQDCLIAAQARKPFDSDINSLLKKVAICNKDSLDKEKDMYSKMFRGLRSTATS